MTFTKQAAFTKKPTDLPDVPSPSYTATDIKSYFETPSDELMATVNDVVDTLNSTTDGNSGADNIGATGFDGTASNIQTLLNYLKANKTDLTGDHKGTWQGYTPSKADPGISSVVDQNTTQLTQKVNKSDLFLNVKDYGADPTGVKSSTDAFQSAINACITNGGGTIFVPTGIYLIDGTVVADLSSGVKINIIGSGSSNCTIKVASDITAFSITGGTSGTNMHLNMLFEGFTLTPVTGSTGTGINIKIGAFCQFHDLYFLSLKYGMITEDFLSSTLDYVRFRFCQYGMYIKQKNVFSNPNAISFFQCHFGENANYGIKIENPANISFYGGSIEGNGNTGTDSEKYGLKVTSAGVEGGIGVNLFGVYLENNNGNADIWIIQGANSANFNFNACNFNRSTAGSVAPYAIRIDQQSTDGDIHLSLPGCNFRGFGNYVPNANTPYVKLFTSGKCFLDKNAAYYGSALERPTIATSDVFLRVRFDGTVASPVPVGGFNVASITKVTTGRYTINFNTPTNATGKLVFVSFNDVGFGLLFSETTSSITVDTRNASNINTDYSDISVLVFE